MINKISVVALFAFISALAACGGSTRGYHSFALLLKDGRVLIGGGKDLPTHPRRAC